MFELILAKVIALSAAAKVGLATATAASVVAVGGATGVVPVLPEQAERPAAEQVVVDEAEFAPEADAADAQATEVPDEDADAEATADKAAADEAEAPAPQSSFGARVSTDAQDGGVDGATISEEARNRPRPEQASSGQEKAAESQAKREQAPAGSTDTAEDSDDEGDEAAEGGSAHGDQGRETAANAPADDDTDQE